MFVLSGRFLLEVEMMDLSSKVYENNADKRGILYVLIGQRDLKSVISWIQLKLGKLRMRKQTKERETDDSSQWGVMEAG